MQISDYLEDLVIDHLLRAQAHTPAATIYLALFTTATDDAGGGTEATGGSYTRKAVTLAAPASGASSNTAAVTFPNMPAGTFTHAALTDNATPGAGEFLFHGPLVAPKIAVAGQTIEVPAGDLDVGFSAGSHATTYLRNLIINRFLRNQAHTPAATIYGALYEDATTEVTGGSYSRSAMSLVAASGGATSSAAEVGWTGMPAGDVTHFGVADAASAGNVYLLGPVDATVTPAAGDTVRLPLGDYTLVVR